MEPATRLQALDADLLTAITLVRQRAEFYGEETKRLDAFLRRINSIADGPDPAEALAAIRAVVMEALELDMDVRPAGAVTPPVTMAPQW